MAELNRHEKYKNMLMRSYEYPSVSPTRQTMLLENIAENTALLCDKLDMLIKKLNGENNG